MEESCLGDLWFQQCMVCGHRQDRTADMKGLEAGVEGCV